MEDVVGVAPVVSGIREDMEADVEQEQEAGGCTSHMSRMREECVAKSCLGGRRAACVPSVVEFPDVLSKFLWAPDQSTNASGASLQDDDEDEEASVSASADKLSEKLSEKLSSLSVTSEKKYGTSMKGGKSEKSESVLDKSFLSGAPSGGHLGYLFHGDDLESRKSEWCDDTVTNPRYNHSINTPADSVKEILLPEVPNCDLESLNSVRSISQQSQHSSAKSNISKNSNINKSSGGNVVYNVSRPICHGIVPPIQMPIVPSPTASERRGMNIDIESRGTPLDASEETDTVYAAGKCGGVSINDDVREFCILLQ